MPHIHAHRHAGQTVKIRDDVRSIGGRLYKVEDYWDRVSGKSWMDSNGNMAAMQYAMRSAGDTPFDNEVLYGKIDGLGYLVHVSELAEETER